MNRKVSFNGLAQILTSLSEEEQWALVQEPGEFKKFAGDLVIQIAQNIFFTPISDQDIQADLAETARSWRRLAAELGYTGPIAWEVKPGFTLKEHAPKAGPCHDNFQHLQGWDLKNDEPTEGSLVFWVPRLVGKEKNVEGQRAILAERRQHFSLPKHHLTSFGNAALLSGLILAHFRRVGERVPLNKEWSRTDTLNSDGDRLDLGGFDGHGLRCGRWRWGDGHGGPSVGCFPLGVELGK